MLGETHFILPTIEFIAGGNQTHYFDVYAQDGTPFNYDKDVHHAYFSLTKFNAELNDDPIFSIAMHPTSDDDDAENPTHTIYVELEPSHTMNLNGKYIYQVMIRQGSSGPIEPPMQGVMYVYKNIDIPRIIGGS